MPAFDVGDVVRAPFPYTDRSTIQRRPALVVATEGLGPDDRLTWVLMITSAENRAWPRDISVSDLALAGLPSASVVRCAKIATVEAARLERVGRLDGVAMNRVKAELDGLLRNRPRRADSR